MQLMIVVDLMKGDLRQHLLKLKEQWYVYTLTVAITTTCAYIQGYAMHGYYVRSPRAC